MIWPTVMPYNLLITSVHITSPLGANRTTHVPANATPMIRDVIPAVAVFWYVNSTSSIATSVSR
jgi:hypothetical protein